MIALDTDLRACAHGEDSPFHATAAGCPTACAEGSARWATPVSGIEARSTLGDDAAEPNSFRATPMVRGDANPRCHAHAASRCLSCALSWRLELGWIHVGTLLAKVDQRG